VETKICSKCGQEKPISAFNFRSKSQNLYKKRCKNCVSKYECEFRLKKLQARKEKQKRWADKNRDHYRQYGQQWRNDNKDRVLQYQSDRLKSDINFRLCRLLRGRLNSFIRFGDKSGSAVKDLGCSIEELKVYLESKFQEGMSWDNWSKIGWHIDHIIPLSSFNLQDPEEFKKACHYTNLQPLWAEDNLKKSNKYSG
jgi:hypothetical protein